ncbi:MAG TPA: hypothetical protein DCW68_00910 [Rhodospirillaceae bacterium]|nr:MAG: hypothetical protein A2018_00700 [Alphaproteobacteria bacterium GWF2_58_20]HAU28660.1 hypothetical protein [Rhodospirillaceae bacterium]
MKIQFKLLLRRLLGMKLYEVFMATRKLGYIPHIRHPRSFNEKILHRKLYRWQKIPPELADKWAVREHVGKTIGSEYLNEVYGVFDCAEDIDFSKLPESFVLKVTHGSHMNIFVKNREEFDEGTVRKKCRRFLATRYGYLTNELYYDRIPPRIMAERCLSDQTLDEISDYKFYVFDGRVEYVQVDRNRHASHHTCRVYSRNWERMVYPFRQPSPPRDEKPALLEKMIQLAEKLAWGWDFVRIDLYSPNQESIIFGEITMTPAAGWQRFTDKAFDMEISHLWNMP